MLRLTWIFAWNTLYFIGFVVLRLKYECYVFILTYWQPFLNRQKFACTGLTWSLSTMFQSYHATGSSMLIFIVLPHWSIMPKTLDMISHPVTLSYTGSITQSLRYPCPNAYLCSTIFNDFGMSQPGIEPVTSRSPELTFYRLSYRGWYRLK